MELTEERKRKSPGWKKEDQDRNLRETVGEWADGRAL